MRRRWKRWPGWKDERRFQFVIPGQSGEWVLSQSRSAASTRVCQPCPEARKAPSTSGDNRIVMRSLVLTALGLPRNLVCSESGKSSKRTDCLIISGVHSGLSVSTCSGFDFLRIAFNFPGVGFAETDHPNCLHPFPQTPANADVHPAFQALKSAIQNRFFGCRSTSELFRNQSPWPCRRTIRAPGGCGHFCLDQN